MRTQTNNCSEKWKLFESTDDSREVHLSGCSEGPFARLRRKHTCNSDRRLTCVYTVEVKRDRPIPPEIVGRTIYVKQCDIKLSAESFIPIVHAPYSWHSQLSEPRSAVIVRTTTTVWPTPLPYGAGGSRPGLLTTFLPALPYVRLVPMSCIANANA